MMWNPKTALLTRVVTLAALVAAVLVAVTSPPPARDPAPLRIMGEIQHFSLERNPRTVKLPRFLDAGGRETSLDALRGKVVVLNFWATWCAPCVHELPSLDRLAAHFKGRPLALVALNEDRGGAAVAAPFLARLGLPNLALYIDPKGAVQRALGVASLPTTIIFDARGRLVGRLAMPADWAAPEALALVEHFVSQVR